MSKLSAQQSTAGQTLWIRHIRIEANVPQHDHAVIASRYELRSEWRSTNGCHPARMPLEGAKDEACFNVPGLDSLVI